MEDAWDETIRGMGEAMPRDKGPEESDREVAAEMEDAWEETIRGMGETGECEPNEGARSRPIPRISGQDSANRSVG